MADNHKPFWKRQIDALLSEVNLKRQERGLAPIDPERKPEDSAGIRQERDDLVREAKAEPPGGWVELNFPYQLNHRLYSKPDNVRDSVKRFFDGWNYPELLNEWVDAKGVVRTPAGQTAFHLPSRYHFTTAEWLWSFQVFEREAKLCTCPQQIGVRIGDHVDNCDYTKYLLSLSSEAEVECRFE